MYKQYTPAQKAAYYKKKAAASSGSKRAVVRRPAAAKQTVRRAPRVHADDKHSYSYGYKKKSSPWNMGGMGSVLGGIAGSMFGGPAGGAIGSALGDVGGSLLGKITGLGDYKISYNTLMGNSEKMLSGDSVPAVQNTHSGIRICHREYITDISSSTAFNINTYNINPGLSGTFPWLSAVAQNFQQYRLHGMIFTFVSTSAEALNSTNTALGTVILATNYNSSSAAFTSKGQMENNEFTTSSKPSVNVMHMIECDPNVTLQEGKFYIRTGTLPPNQDIKTYDVGLFQIATVGSQASAVIGELHVSYDIEFMKPIDLSQTNNSNGFAHYYSNTGVTTSNYFGTAQTLRSDDLGITFGAAVINLPSSALPGQQYSISLWYFGTSASLVAPGLTLANCTRQAYYQAGTTNGQSTGGATGTTLAYNFIIQVSNTATPSTPPTVTLTGGTLPTSPYVEIIIDAIPANAL